MPRTSSSITGAPATFCHPGPIHQCWSTGAAPGGLGGEQGYPTASTAHCCTSCRLGCGFLLMVMLLAAMVWSGGARACAPAWRCSLGRPLGVGRRWAMAVWGAGSQQVAGVAQLPLAQVLLLSPPSPVRQEFVPSCPGLTSPLYRSLFHTCAASGRCWPQGPAHEGFCWVLHPTPHGGAPPPRTLFGVSHPLQWPLSPLHSAPAALLGAISPWASSPTGSPWWSQDGAGMTVPKQLS